MQCARSSPLVIELGDPSSSKVVVVVLKLVAEGEWASAPLHPLL